MWNREVSPSNESAAQPPGMSPAKAAPAEERRLVAWVGKAVVFRGDLISSEDMNIDGRVEGNIELRDYHLTIGPNATIEADVVARLITIFGKVTGTVTAQEKIDIRLGASVQADLSCQTLAVQEGAYVCGKVATAAPQATTAKGKGDTVGAAAIRA